jgi:hypothetical protein
MRNGTKLKQLLEICDISLSLEDGVIRLTTVNKATYQNRMKEGPSFSAVLDKAYRQMLKDARSGMDEEE